MKLTSRQNTERWEIMDRNLTSYDCSHVDGLAVDQLDALITAGYLDPRSAQNDSPTVAEFLEFMRDHPEMRAHGYVIRPDRDDARISLEGLEFNGRPSRTLLIDFTKAFHHSDEFQADNKGLRCWWD